MSRRTASAAWLCLLATAAAAPAANAPVLPPGEKAPVLKIEAGGPTSFVTALAFSPDGRTLYAAGWDKVVRTWSLDDKGKFALARAAFRVPIGPGLDGAINAIALSDDGTWLAAGGSSPFRGGAGFRQPGLILPTLGALTPEMWKDRGMIYVWNTRTGAVRLLRGTRGDVTALAFAPGRQGQPLLLVSAAREEDTRPNRTSDRTGTVRLWDVGQEKNIDAQYLPDPEWRRPLLSVWYPTNGNRLQAALGWGDRNLYVWDWAQGNDVLRTVRDAQYDPVAHLPGQDQAVSAVFGAGKVRLEQWDIAPGKDPDLAAAPAALPAGANADTLPWALGLVSEKGNNQADYAAVISFRSLDKDRQEYGLQLLDLGANRFGALKAEVPALWRGTLKQPVLATSLRGEYLAAAGSDSHEILVYRVSDLVAGKPKVQPLSGVGTALHTVAFVTHKQKGLGLLLNERDVKQPGKPPLKPGANDLIFDFAARGLTSDLAGWALSTPALANWHAEEDAGAARPSIAVFQGDRLVRTVRLKAEQVITDFALLPPQGAKGRPILAVAYHEAGEPTLALFDAETGERFRELAGHSDRIYCLAFSGDGRLLASAGEDQTICVWTMTNVRKVLGYNGLVPGLAVRNVQGNVVVGRVEDDSPAKGKLAVGDTVEGFVENGKLQRVDTARDYYEAITAMRPGVALTLRVRDANGARDVALTVGQGVDQRKPLFTLFVTREGKAGAREWIGWNPVGPYDASSPRAERFIGWHFNTGDPAAPTRFAYADQYRKDYYREGLLDKLVARASLPPEVLAPPPRPAPRLVPVIDVIRGAKRERIPPDDQGQILVRQAAVDLHVDVLGRPLDTLDSASWKLDDGQPKDFVLEASTGGRLLAPLQLARGVHRIRVVAHTLEDPKREHAEEITVRYQPPAPAVDLGNGPARQAVMNPAFRLQAQVKPGLPGENVRVTVTQFHNGDKVEMHTETAAVQEGKPLVLDRDFTLKPGFNRIEIVAANKDALPGHEEEETDRQAVEVTLTQKQKARPPVISLERVTLPDTVDRPQEIEAGKPVLVHAAHVRVTGSVKAGENLSVAEWLKGRAAEPAPLTNFAADKDVRLEINQDLRLQPGEQTIHFRARTATSDPAEATLTLYYRPAVPFIELQPLQAGPVLQGQADTAEVALTALVHPADDPQPYDRVILVNDKVLDKQPAIQERAGVLTAKVPVTPGENRIQIRVSNRWGSVFTSEPVLLRYLRPPRVVSLKRDGAEDARPVLDLVAEVRSPLPLKADTVRVEVNGKARAHGKVTVEQGGGAAATVHVKGVALDGGEEKGEATKNEIRLWVSNGDGECAAPDPLVVTFKPEQPPPSVEFLQPREDSITVAQPKVSVRILVRSTTPLRRVGLAIEGRREIPVDLVGLKADARGQFELKTEVEVPLPPGLTQMRVEAANAGGEVSSTPLTVNYPKRPVQVIIDSLLPLGGASDKVEPERLPDGGLRVPELATGRVQLRGRVVWDEKADERIKKARLVRIYVNGFQQMPALLKPPAKAGARERAFETVLAMSQAAGNQVFVDIPGLEQEAGSRTDFTADCRSPLRAERLHVFALSSGSANGKTLKRQVLGAFQAKDDPSGAIKAPVFDSVSMYGPLVGYEVRPVYVYTQLINIREEIEGAANAGVRGNDLVVFYYHGREVVDAQGNRFRTSMTADELKTIFAETPGAHLLLFDVDQNKAGTAAKDKIDHWENSFPEVSHHVAVLHYAWLGPDNVPHDSRLLQLLETALPQTPDGHLDEVMTTVHKETAASPEYQKLVMDSEFVPGDMRGKAILLGQGQQR